MKKILFSFSILVFSYSQCLSQGSIITTIAGGNIGNNVPATQFGMNAFSVAPDNSGNVYIADAANHIIHKLNISSGQLTVFAGNGSYGYSRDGGQATDAQFNYPVAVAMDHSNSSLYIVDESDQCVRKVDISSGIITTVAGNGSWGFSGDNGPATNAQFNNPLGIAIDTNNDLFITDYSNNRIREVNSAGIITTIAGTDSTGYNRDSIPADSAWLHSPAGIALDKAGNIYFIDQNNCRIRMIKASNDTIYTISGGKAGFSGDGGPSTKAKFWYPLGIAVDASGNVYIGDTYDNRIREITISNDTINTIVGNGNGGFSGDGGLATASELNQPRYLAFDAAGNLFFADMGNNRVREILASNNTITTLAGDGIPGYNGNNISALSAQLLNPTYVASDDSGNIFISDNGNSMIREVNAKTGNILKIAGMGAGGYSGDGGPAGKAYINGPNGLAYDTGSIVFADEYNNRIRIINLASNTIKTIAGNGHAGYIGNGGTATAAELYYPVDVTIDGKGNIYIADMINDRIREITPSNGKIKTIAGNGYNATNWSGGFSGDGGIATNAELNQPQGVAVDKAGTTLYIADTWNLRIRKVDLSSGRISTVAGNGNWGYSGDNGPATASTMTAPTSVRLDVYGNYYFADFYNNVVRQVNVWDSNVVTVAGDGSQTYGGDGGPSAVAQLDLAHGLAFDPWGNLLVADYGNNRIRKIDYPASVQNLKEQGSISVYPNPATDNIYIHISGFRSEQATLEIRDITGRIILQKTIDNLFSAAPIQVNVSGLSSGIYLVNLKSSTQQLTSKIIKE